MKDIESLEKMRRYFDTGITQSYAFRIEQLKKLKATILKHEKELYSSLHSDLGKSEEESWVTELGMVIAEISAALKGLRDWMRPKQVGTNLLNLPSGSRILSEPLGVVMIIGPWNYPHQLLIDPLVGAIAAGNCAVLKPSEFAPATAATMGKMIRDAFPPEYIMYAEGDGAEVVPQLMNNFTFDHIFYTGSTTVGKIIYKMAAERLVPVTLELGGKSPCIIEDDANIAVAARRIAMTKFTNAGQMCVAPDFVLVKESVKEKFVSALKDTLLKFFSDKPEDNYEYCHIINERQFDRLIAYLSQGKLRHGGRFDRKKLFIEPAIIEPSSTTTGVMKDEIFGPILPVISFQNNEEALKIIRQNPNPLAFYVYSSSKKKQDEWIRAVPAGGTCINNSSWHLTNHHLPFGGRGFSGTGSYHGKYSFDTFSHKRAIMKTPTWFDPSIRYPPFKGKLKLFKWVIR